MARTIFRYYLCLTLAAVAFTSFAVADSWQPLGSYSLLNPAGFPTSRFLQLSVDPNGQLRGTYFDGIRDISQPLRGRIDSRTQQASWRIDGMSQYTFRTSLGDLMQPSGSVQISQPGGPQETWRITRQGGWR